MENQHSVIGTLLEKTEHYARSSAELYKLKTIDKSAEVISSLISRLAILLFASLFFLILNIGIALYLGEILGRSYYGFFIVSGFYALAGIVVYFFRTKWIKAPLKNSIISQALN